MQPRVRVIDLFSKEEPGIKRSKSETPLSVQEEEKDTIVHQLSTPREIKNPLKSLPRGVGKAGSNIIKQQQIQ